MVWESLGNLNFIIYARRNGQTDRVGGGADGGRELGFEGGRGRVGECGGGVVFEDMPRLLKILVMVGGDGGGRGRATVQMPRLLILKMRGGSAQDHARSNNNMRV